MTSASSSQKRCHAAGWPYISALVCAKLFEWPPSIAYDASVNGAPAKPISGTRPPSSRLIWRIASSTCASASRGSNRRTRVEVGLGAQRVLDRRPFALDEVERDAHRLERQQQIGEQDRRVDLDAAHRLQRDFGREIGRSAELEQRIALAQRAVLAHVAAGLAHEPDGRRVDRLPAAGLEESATRVGQWVTLRRLRARPTRSSSHSGLNRSSAPSSRSSVETASSRK